MAAKKYEVVYTDESTEKVIADDYTLVKGFYVFTRKIPEDSVESITPEAKRPRSGKVHFFR